MRTAAAGGNRSATHTQLRQSVCDYLGLQGAWFLPILGGLGIRRGSPDVVASLRGRFIAVECKTGNAELDRHQRGAREWLERAGAIYVECRRLEDLQEALDAAGLTLMGRLT